VRLLVCIAVLLSLLIAPRTASAYSVLSHEALVDAVWDDVMSPLLRRKFPRIRYLKLHRQASEGKDLPCKVVPCATPLGCRMEQPKVVAPAEYYHLIRKLIGRGWSNCFSVYHTHSTSFFAELEHEVNEIETALASAGVPAI